METTKLTYFGHAAFMLTHGNTSLIVDPFLTNNPWGKGKAEDIKAQYILVTHGHDDHYGDTNTIAKANDALLISTAEIAHKAAESGCRTHAMHIGGKFDFDFGSIRLTPAFHGSGVPGGHACGAIITFFDRVVYYAGDTGFFGDMRYLTRFGDIDYALLPMGDNFTMGIEDAALAASLIKANVNIPIHFKTWPVIDKDPEEFVRLVEDKYKMAALYVEPGSTIDM